VAGGGFSVPAVLKPKRRGRGDARAPLDEGNGGGGREASGPVRRRWPEVHGAATLAGRWRLGRCPMKVTTPGSLTRWAHRLARGR
jgi:hypothetical protein